MVCKMVREGTLHRKPENFTELGSIRNSAATCLQPSRKLLTVSLDLCSQPRLNLVALADDGSSKRLPVFQRFSGADF